MGRRKVSFFFFFLFGESELARQRERVFGSCRGVFLFLCVPSERARQRERELFFVSRRRFSFSSPPSERGSASEFFFFFFWLASLFLSLPSERASLQARASSFFLSCPRFSLSSFLSTVALEQTSMLRLLFFSRVGEEREKSTAKKQQQKAAAPKKKKNSTPKPPTHLADVLVW